MSTRFALAALSSFAVACASGGAQRHSAPSAGAPRARPVGPNVSCFLLYELGVGEVRRAPAVGCGERVTPASTFKIPHALAALDAGVVTDASTSYRYDGSPTPFPTWQRDHTLASAMRYSVVWYFQRIADALGPAREREYLSKFQYGNEDASSSPRRFWIEGSLAISPDEQERFLERLYEGSLPVSAAAMQTVRDVLVQPRGFIVNATGAHAFAQPWPDSVVLSAKTGSASYASGVDVEWLVGHVSRGTRSWVFVSCVTHWTENYAPASPLAAHALREAKVL